MFEYGKEVTIGDNVWLGGNLFRNEEIDDETWKKIIER